jgi:hypothetical protein
MEIISTSRPSFANAPLSFAIQSDAMVPDVNRKAIRNGRGAAARGSGAATKASNRIKVVRANSLLCFVAMAAL